MEDLPFKIKILNLLPITENLVAYICEFDPCWLTQDMSKFSYAKFLNGNVYLYTKEYIDSVTIDQFDIEFSRLL